jgi:hypothetical protein
MKESERMIQNKVICDKCGKEIAGGVYYTVYCNIMPNPDGSVIALYIDNSKPSHYHSECYHTKE